MSNNLTSTLNITSTLPNEPTIPSYLVSGSPTLTQLTDVDLGDATAGSILIYDINEFRSRVLSGAATLGADGILTLNPNSVQLGTNTVGNYVSTISGTSNQIIVSGSGVEGADITLALPQNISTASSPTFNDITINGTITNSSLTDALDLKAPKHNPFFTGNVQGISKAMVGLGNVDNTSDANKEISNLAAAALATKIESVVLGGDATGTSSASAGIATVNVTLANSGVNAGTYGGTATSNRTFTVDSKGRVTAVGEATTITPSFANITDKPDTISGYNITDAASKTYVDEITSHETVRVIVKQPLAVNYSIVNSGQLISDTSVNWAELLSDTGLVSGSRLLIAGQSIKSHNGIYVIVDNTTLQRAVDFNSPRKMAGGDTVFVTHGAYADTCWALRETVSVVGTSPVEFVQISGAGAVEVGAGLVRSNTTISMPTVGTPGAYKSVTTDEYGRVTAGSNPTLLSGFGITDAVTIDTAQSITGQKTFSLSPHVPEQPTEATHAVSKSYVDAVAEGLNVHESAHVLLRAPLATLIGGGATVAYNNGVEGVGATLISSVSVNWATKLGDPDLLFGNRIIVAGETNEAHNGIYVIDSATTLIRADDFDSPVEMDGGDFVFVTHGTYADTGWVLNQAVPTVGLSPVTFVQFSGAGAYEAGNGLLREGTVFKVKGATGITVNGDGVSLGAVGTAGVYKSVTTDEYGRVTSGSNPTLLSEYGITDAVSIDTVQSITGQKTFDSNVNVPLIPTEMTHATSRSYVDAQYQGITAEIGSVTSVSPTSPATVTNIGNSKAVKLDFAIPRGIQGDRGPAFFAFEIDQNGYLILGYNDNITPPTWYYNDQGELIFTF